MEIDEESTVDLPPLPPQGEEEPAEDDGNKAPKVENPKNDTSGLTNVPLTPKVA